MRCLQELIWLPDMTPQLWEILNETIMVCKDLILATFFTILALLVSTYYLLPEFFGSSEEVHPLPPPVQEVGEMNEEEPKQSDSSDSKTPVVGKDSSTTSSSALTPSRPYDVFFSFRGADTRSNFTSHLYAYLVQKGIKTFIDDEELRIGKEISSSLVNAIRCSKISIVIFSENYASSSWCLEELVEILKCRKLKQQSVWPVFYKVDPSDVRHQNGKYGDDFAKHECRFKDIINKVNIWRKALRDAANLSGKHIFNGRNEAEFISKIADEISAQVEKLSSFYVAKYPVGIESRVQHIHERLDIEGNGVCMVGIWGTAGIGKSTIAAAVYNSIRNKFEGYCFLARVSEASKTYQGLVSLQNELLHQILGGKKMEMRDDNRGIQMIKERLGSKRVLIVLDDVDETQQLNYLVGKKDWFGAGSRIIITTRDEGLLSSHDVNEIYVAKALVNDEARNLLILNAFDENKDHEEFEKFPIDTALLYAHGLPLAINILGSLLRGKIMNEWHDTILHFSRFPNTGIQKVLETSFNELQYPLKEVFLDIACLLKGKDKDYVLQALDSSYIPEHAIKLLEQKALVSIDRNGWIWMHGLLENMGKEIVRKESPNQPGRRSRIWFHEDVYRVLTENTGSEEVKGIRVELPREEEICLSTKCFEKMINLQVFININARFSGEVHYLPNQLRFLDWPGFPRQVLPSDFNPRKLVKLSLPNSRISRLGQGLKNLHNLKSLSFEGCKLLKEVPDLSGRFPNLENLNLSRCKSLTKLHHSVGCLGKLVDLNLRWCSNLEIFPKIVNMKSLRRINFNGCRRLENFPEIVGRMEFLTTVVISRSAIKALPLSIGHDLFNLEILSVYLCRHLTKLPLSIFEMQNLKAVYLRGCRNLELTSTSNSQNPHNGKAISSEKESEDEGGNNVDQVSSSKLTSLSFFEAAGCDNSIFGILVRLDSAVFLRHLDLSYSSFVSLPVRLVKLIKLEKLFLRGCHRLKGVLELPPNLKELDVNGCVSLEFFFKLSESLNIGEWEMLEWLDMGNCWRLYDNLLKEAAKRFNDHNESCLFSLFLSCQKSRFEVVLPGHEIPKWFSCQMDFKGNTLFEFEIQVLANFQWEKTGLALCVTGVKGFIWSYEFFFDQLGVMTHSSRLFDAEYSHQVQIPGLNVAPLKSCGVHLVMPPDEEECMKLVYAQNIGNQS